MAFDRGQITGPLARILIVDHKGSAPRHAGTSMTVSHDGLDGTIGGGALELRAIELARDVLSRQKTMDVTIPLGPTLGQCCGGSVRLVIEYFDRVTLPEMDGAFVRPIDANTPASLAVKRLQMQARNSSEPMKFKVLDGWIIEPIQTVKPKLWLYGAGHVGRAIVDVLDGLDVDITWVDTALDRFPDQPKATPLIAVNPVDAARLAPADADHLIMTYSHVFDLNLCHQILSQPHRSVGVIGSATKRARFTSKLIKLGHSRDHISTLVCPIGDPTLGNHPKAIAIGVAAQLISMQAANTVKERVTR